MNTGAYDITDMYGGVGDNPVLEAYDKLAQKVVRDYYQLAFLALIVLVLLVIYYVWMKPKEGMNPGQTMDQQKVSLSGSDAMTAAPQSLLDKAKSVFVQTQADVNAVPVVAGQVGPAQNPNSLAYKVLHSPDFACDTRTPSSNDAWSWMSGVASGPETFRLQPNLIKEGLRSSDDVMSNILAGGNGQI